MSLRFQAVCVDAVEPGPVADFWQAVLGWRRTFDDGREIVLEPPAGSAEDGVAPDLVFLEVPEPKTLKNRLHIDLLPDDQAAEVARLEGLGARRVSVGQGEDVSWVVLADTEGNELCVLQARRPDET